MLEIPIFDLIALIWAFAWWIGYTLFADSTTRRRNSISAYMARNRHRWMEQMLKRPMRMVDTAIAGNLITGISFFSSTTILVLFGLVSLLGYTHKAIRTVAALPFSEVTSDELWECKVVLLILIFIYAFFKFTWAFRLSNYCSILIGGAPEPSRASEQDAYRAAARASRMSMMSAHNFNRGIRSYCFGLSAIAWFYHPIAFMFGATLATIILYNREFGSHALNILSGSRK